MARVERKYNRFTVNKL